MAIEQIMKSLLAADKATLAKVADVLTHRDKPSNTGKTEAETRLLTQKEAAKRLSLSTTSLWRLIREGAIETVNVRDKASER